MLGMRRADVRFCIDRIMGRSPALKGLRNQTSAHGSSAPEVETVAVEFVEMDRWSRTLVNLLVRNFLRSASPWAIAYSRDPAPQRFFVPYKMRSVIFFRELGSYESHSLSACWSATLGPWSNAGSTRVVFSYTLDNSEGSGSTVAPVCSTTPPTRSSER